MPAWNPPGAHRGPRLYLVPPVAAHIILYAPELLAPAIFNSFKLSKTTLVEVTLAPTITRIPEFVLTFFGLTGPATGSQKQPLG
jgi:hypothetical protein